MTEVTNRVVAVADCRPHPQNYNRHDGGQIGDLRLSLRKFGQVRSIVVQDDAAGGYLIVAGHGIISAARLEGITELRADVIPADWPPVKVLAYLAADNELARRGTPDEAQLAALVAQVKEQADEELAMLAAGADARLKELLAQVEQGPLPEDPGPQMDKAEELREKWGVELNQLWQLGEHRLICGDCTDRAVVEQVMGEEKAQMAVTSPPYGVGKSYETKGIAAWFETVRPCIANLCRFASVVIWQLGDLYSTGSQFIEPTLAYSINMFSEHGFRPIWLRIWEKQGVNFGIGAYHLVTNKPAQQYEHVLAVASEGDVVDAPEFEWIVGFAGQAHKFVKRLSRQEARAWGYSGVWKINTVQANDTHPAMFPLELPERCIKMHSDPGGIVLEPFSGSGTVIAACERLGRLCRAIEISPAYCAVAVQRWVDMTKKEPKLVY